MYMYICVYNIYTHMYIYMHLHEVNVCERHPRIAVVRNGGADGTEQAGLINTKRAFELEG